MEAILSEKRSAYYKKPEDKDKDRLSSPLVLLQHDGPVLKYRILCRCNLQAVSMFDGMSTSFWVLFSCLTRLSSFSVHLGRYVLNASVGQRVSSLAVF